MVFDIWMLLYYAPAGLGTGYTAVLVQLSVCQSAAVNILAQISKPPPSVCDNISGILKGAFVKFCINNNEYMSYVSVKNIYSNIAI